MPIDCPSLIHDLSQQEFDEIDQVVMAHSYATQNELGRIYDEKVYENDLTLRLREAGHTVETQVPIKVTFAHFKKIYYLDLVCDHAVYDGKTVSAFNGDHKAQVLN